MIGLLLVEVVLIVGAGMLLIDWRIERKCRKRK